MNRAKIASHLLTQLDQAPANQRHRVIVLLHPSEQSEQHLRGFARLLPIGRVFRLIPSFAVHASAGEVAALSLDHRVRQIWPDLRAHTCLEQSAPLVGAPTEWNVGWTGKGIRIGLIDTGLDQSHPDFAGRVDQARDFTGEGDGDQNGHGTHVAGIAAGSGASAGGKYRGIAPEARILVAKALGRAGGGDTSNILAALEWAVEQGAQVVNLSLGVTGPSNGEDPLSLAVDQAVQRGVIVCVAAGNEGPNASTVGIPGASHDALTVGATTKSDELTSFSSRGPTADGRIKPDLSAPGANIVSCRAAGTSLGQVVDEHYTTLSGTSMATPHVTGAMALLRQARPDLSADALQKGLLAVVKKLPDDPNALGAGRLALPNPAVLHPNQPVTVAPGCLIPVTALLTLLPARRGQPLLAADQG